MEQMGSGLLELLQKYTTMNQMNLSQIGTSSTGGESDFGKLLEQKSSETVSESTKTNSSDTRTDKTGKTEQLDTTDKTETTDTVEKTEPSEKDDTEVCDVAREIACAQIVWVVPQVTEEVSAVTGDIVETTDSVGDTMSLLPQGGENTVLPNDVQNEGINTMATVVDTVGQQEQTATFEQTMDNTAEPVENAPSIQSETVDTPVVSTEQETVHPQEQTKTVEQTVQTTDANTWDTAEQSSLSQEDGEDDLTGEAAVETAVFKDVEAAPIKVAEAPAETQAPELKEQVSEQVVKVLDSGENHVEIQLQPEALGKLTIEVSHTADGSLHVALHAENAQTRSLLERTMGSLHEVLAERGQNSVQIEVNQNEETQRQNQQQDLQDGGNHQQQQQQRRRQETSSEDFLQQLRLGLIDFGSEEQS